jgi:Tol biopolymer transport system component
MEIRLPISHNIPRLSSLFLLLLTIAGCSKNPVKTENGCDHCILFRAGGYYHTEIFTICPDGTNLRQLTHTKDLIRNYDAAWSPDGSQIVFVRSYWSDYDTVVTNDLYLMDANGRNQRKLPGTSKEWAPLFSPDGTKIAFWSERDGIVKLYVMNVDGTNQIKLSDDEGIPQRGYSWSPDGMYIVYSTSDDRICKVDSDGNSRVELCSGGEPRWSPNGSLIAFTTPWGSNDIVVMNPDGSEQRQLTDFTIETASWPVWSPDGSQILFLFYDKENTENARNNIYIMNRDGTEQRKLTENNAMKPAWSPDGSQITYMCDQRWTDDWQIWIMGADGTNQTKLTSIGGGHPKWQP